ncbi:MAG: hypothetical protein ACYDG2_21860 [Ruminiclostridium sp.]
MKRFSLVLTMVLLVANIISGTVFAQTDSDKIGNEEVFQKILDKVNAEYGTNVRPATDDELKSLGVSRADVQKKLSNVSPAQYEADLRESIKAAENEKKISQEAWDKAQKAGILEKDFKPVSKPNSSLGIITYRQLYLF